MLFVNERLTIPLREFDFTFARSSGPGGQNVNKVNTKVTLHWPASSSTSLSEEVRERFLARYRSRMTKDGVLVIWSQRFRNRGRNVADCLAKLRAMLLAVAAAPRQRKSTRPTRAANRRRLRQKRERSEKKRRRQMPGMDE